MTTGNSVERVSTRHLIRCESTKADAGIAPVQALLISLSARLGTGNIAGVATAIAMGGPGAVVWMWIAAALGMATAAAACAAVPWPASLE